MKDDEALAGLDAYYGDNPHDYDFYFGPPPQMTEDKIDTYFCSACGRSHERPALMDPQEFSEHIRRIVARDNADVALIASSGRGRRNK